MRRQSSITPDLMLKLMKVRGNLGVLTAMRETAPESVKRERAAVVGLQRFCAQMAAREAVKEAENGTAS